MIDDAEDLDIIMQMYNVLEYSQNYSMISESLCNYYRDEIKDVDNNASNGKQYPYQDGDQIPRSKQPPILALNKEFVIPLKTFAQFLEIFWFGID